jgi:hypothetical protein
MSNTTRNVIVAALLGITAGCGGTSPVAPAVVVPVAPVVPAGTYTLTPSANAVARGGQLSVSWTVSSTVETGNDWIEFSRTSDPNMFYGWAGYTEGARSGTFTFTAPNQAGHYEFRYLLDDGWTDAARSTEVTVF